jgi:hypothetical protein
VPWFLNKAPIITFRLEIAMNKLINCFSGIISWLHKATPHCKLNAAIFKNLEDIKLVIPTADAKTILRLDELFNDHSLTLINNDLAESLRSIIDIEKEEIKDFNFNEIQSLTNSKSFGAGLYKTINGSWFKDLHSWGKGMYSAKNMKAEDDSDWQDNIWHIEHEGFPPRDPLHILYYS